MSISVEAPRCPKHKTLTTKVEGRGAWYCSTCREIVIDNGNPPITPDEWWKPPRGKSRHQVSSADKRTADGITFDSQLEMKRYLCLKDMQTAGLIAELQLQPYFSLDPNWVHVATYRADFTYIVVANGERIFEDVKSVGPSGTINNRDAKLSMGMVRALHKGVTITVVTSRDKGNTWELIPAEKVYICEEGAHAKH